MVKIHLRDISLRTISITIIIAASIVLIISVTEFGSFGIAYSQVVAHYHHHRRHH
jgi:hypothetical protein